MKNKFITSVKCLSLMTFFLLSACTAGDLRGISDALNASNGKKIHYKDTRKTARSYDVKITYGVEGGDYYYRLKNTGNEYCKAVVTFENDSKDVFKLNPRESTGTKYGSKYNQLTGFEALCSRTSSVFSSSFN